MKILGPSGARAQIMDGNMGSVRNTIAGLCTAAKWKPVQILSDYSLVSDQINIRVAAENERAKAQWLCQMAAAYVAEPKSRWLVLDRADVLLPEDWDGLTTLCTALCLKNPELHIVVCKSGDSTLAPDGWSTINLAAA